MKFNINKKFGKNSKFIVKLDLEEDLEDLKDMDEDSDEGSQDFEEELKKVNEIASSRGIGCRIAEKLGGKIVKNKAKIKIAPKGVIIVSPPENDKRILWENIVSSERWTHDSLKINLVRDTEKGESPVIYLTNCYSAVFLVKIINDSASGDDDEGWAV